MTESLHVHPVAAPLGSIASKFFVISNLRNETKLYKVIARGVADDATMRTAAGICQEDEKEIKKHKQTTMFLHNSCAKQHKCPATDKTYLVRLTMYFVVRSRMHQKVGGEP